MPAAAHLRFIELLDDLDLAAGQFAFKEGDPPDRFLFLTEGRVALEAPGLKSLEFSGFAVVGWSTQCWNGRACGAAARSSPAKR